MRWVLRFGGGLAFTLGLAGVGVWVTRYRKARNLYIKNRN